MRSLSPLEIGVVFWAGGDPPSTLAELIRLGFRSGQLVVPGDLDVSCASEWRIAAEEAEFEIYTAVAAFNGESYRDIPTVQRTVGFVPPATRSERERRMLAVSDFASAVRARGIATHIGFVPDDPADPEHSAMVDLVRRVCDHAARYGQTFALETGQETAEVLLNFIKRVDRTNLGINFDPANLILYGTGDPIEALRLLAPHVVTVHAKDGNWPAANVEGALGVEQALGTGAVGMERFIQTLKSVGYSGPLAIEREAENPAVRMKDIESGALLLRRLLG